MVFITTFLLNPDIVLNNPYFAYEVTLYQNKCFNLNLPD
jgi:hypothetical protein